jgi:small conductance mechanosensitive channel
LQGSLANFAGGVLILILKPFRVGDYISGAGHSGTVDQIQIFYTYLRTPQNQIITVPNGNLSNDPIINYTAEHARRLDQTYSIAYSDDIDKARGILLRLIEEDERISKEPAPEVLVDNLGDNSVDLKIRVWSNIDVFWPLHWDMQEKVKKAFDEEGITIPFPQLDVHQR